ncbi:uncharacterized protein yc1106_09166 [Curvularia clavata]|uniref:Methyltransferase domain-containing protein n=1 Tax=Curvularia clavata TaxID=95742 RepID=A0A9Q9DWI1_CURCL|nr:uncharacterized protein yc1106_09166 [Curvularia clavata]
MPVNEMFEDDLAISYESSTGGCTRELAIHILDILPSIDVNSNVLDNACGNGIVAQEFFYRYPDTPLTMTCVDKVKDMVDLARRSVPICTTSTANISFDVMDGENLLLPDNTFTHSVTNCGIFFFEDAVKGASEIYRTLKPGGTAVITTWKNYNYIQIIHEAQQLVKPDEELLKWAVADEWSTASHLQDTLEKGGFRDIQIQEKLVYYATKSIEELCGNIMDIWTHLGPKWTEEENAELGRHILEIGKRSAVKIKRPVNGKRGAELVDVVGLPREAHIAIARK